MSTFILAKVIETNKSTYSSVIEFTPEDGVVHISIEDCKNHGSDVMSFEDARNLWRDLIQSGYKQLG